MLTLVTNESFKAIVSLTVIDVIDDDHFVGSVCFATEYSPCPITPENVSLNVVNCNDIWKNQNKSAMRHYHHHHQVSSYSKSWVLMS